MPSKTGKTYASFYKNDLAIDQASNTGVDTTVRKIQDGLGQDTVIALSDDQLVLKPVNDNTTGTMIAQTATGDTMFLIDTSNKRIICGANATNALTLVKEFGIYDFSPTAGYHYPLIANTMFVPTGATAFAGDNDWGNGADPATTLDVSGLTQQENAIAIYWFIHDDITLDEVRYIATADGSATLNFHLFGYTLDTSSNHGDLSAGTVHANASVSATATTVKTGTFTLDEADIDSGKVVVAFVENVTDTSDVSVSIQAKYHIR